jgi:hypothetical protein
VDTFKIKFGITTADTQFTSDTGGKLSIVIWAQLNDTANFGTSYYKLQNLNVAQQIEASLSTKVGDGVRFSLDGKRPVSTVVLDSVRLDSAAYAAPVSGLVPFKIGSKIAMRLHINTANVLGANVKQARVIVSTRDRTST